MKTIIGIDPGVSGGIAIIDPETRTERLLKMPETLGDLVEELASIAWNSETQVVCYLEELKPAPPISDGKFKRGSIAQFKIGRSFGNLEGILAALKIRTEVVGPKKWQAALSCLSGGDKRVTKAKAQQLFPSHKITHATADALLIAEYGRRMETGL